MANLRDMRSPSNRRPAAPRVPAAALVTLALSVAALGGCAAAQARRDPPTDGPPSQPTTAPATQPAGPIDTTAAKPIEPRDALEGLTLERGADFHLIDRLMDQRTEPPPFARQPLPPARPDARLSADVPVLDERQPFPPQPELEPKAPSIHVALARSTFRTHTPPEVFAAIQPFFDLEQRDVDVRADVALFETPDGLFYALSDGKQQLAISNVFDYLLVRSWFGDAKDNGSVILGEAQPGWPKTFDARPGQPGIPGAAVALVVRTDAPYHATADLRGARLALAANDTHGPGTFLTQVLREAGQPYDQQFFASVTLRHYAKDAVIDLLRNRADVACVTEPALAALQRVYGIEARVRTLAFSPRYDFDVLYTSMNNVATHRTEIESTQRQLTTLKKDPEGQEVLYFFDEDGWQYPENADLAVAEAAFNDFLTFWEHTPLDLKVLLDPAAPIDRRTYDRWGNE